MTQALQIIPIPAFEDNYIWLLHDGDNAIVVDPGDAAPVLAILASTKLVLRAILITHHHADHIGGVAALQAKCPDAKVYAPKHENFAFDHVAVAENDTVEIAFHDALNTFPLKFKVLDLPGHTLGHIAFTLLHAGKDFLFCGDTLFGAGCGRLFEGSPTQMLSSLKKLAALPVETQVYCTHEYTLHNIHFALTIDANNQALIAREQATQQTRRQQKPSLPSTIALELATNPFLRCTSDAIKISINQKNATELETFSRIRELRNHY